MKAKDGICPEDALAQLSNPKTSESFIKSLLGKINCSSLTNVQRNRLLKAIVQFVKDGSSSDLRVVALTTGHAVVKVDLVGSATVATGVNYHFFEACWKLVKDYARSPSRSCVDDISKALDILALINTESANKLLSDHGGAIFTKTITECLRANELRYHALVLLGIVMSTGSSILSEAISEEQVLLLQLIYPLIFNLDSKELREAALEVLQKLNLTLKSLPCLSQLKEDTQKIYCKQMVEMVNQKLNWPVLWQFVVNVFGDELHSGGQLINYMLEVLERAFKHSDFEWTRVQAFECWKTLIDNFKNGLKNKKRIELIMIPLKANNHRNETLALAKLKIYDHLLKTIGSDLSAYPEILLFFLSFCFGAEKITCRPVKFYPALHDKCVKSISDVISSPALESIFMRVHKELINAVADCFIIDSSSKLLSPIWDRLLELVSKQEGTDVAKLLLQSINSLVLQANSGDVTAVSKPCRSSSPPTSPSGMTHLNDSLGLKIVVVALSGIVSGKFSLPRNHFRSRSLYVGSSDVMIGTPSLLVMEWLLSPALMLGAGCSKEYLNLVSELMKIRQGESTGFMDFASAILKKLPVSVEKLPLSKKTLLFQYTTDVWSTVVDGIVEHRQNQGELNQGNIAEPEFGALYSVLNFPLQQLYMNFDLIEKCRLPWERLFYEACQSAELGVNTSAEHICEQVCIRLTAAGRQSTSPKLLAAVYVFLACILKASGRFKSTKMCRWTHQHVSSIIKELHNGSINDDLVFSQALTCVLLCLQPKLVTGEMISNLSSTICSLFKGKVYGQGSVTFDSIDKLCTLLVVLKQSVSFAQQHDSSNEFFGTVVKDVLQAGRAHSSQKIRAKLRELFDSSENKTPVKEFKSSKIDSKSPNAAASPTSVFHQSPKVLQKKFTPILMSPSNLSPGSAKRKLQTTVHGSDGKFVRIETPPKKVILTEHQKEVRRERREDIPALYQDLSQDTQSMSQDISQDCVALPLTPNKKLSVPIHEDAVMDVEDVDSGLQILAGKKLESPKTLKAVSSPHSVISFTPPAGFMLVTDGVAKSDFKKDQNLDAKSEDPAGKENEDKNTPSKSDKVDKSTPRGAITRSNSNLITTTRSGKILKRNSLLPESDVKMKRKSVRKSLPINCSEDLSKASIAETVPDTDTTDSESISSIASDTSGTTSKTAKAPASKRRRTFTKKVNSQESLEVEKTSFTSLNSSDEAHVTETSVKGNNSPKGSDQPVHTHLPNVVGGKVLTRSRSNSSLDEFVGSTKALKESTGPRPTGKVMSPIQELNSKTAVTTVGSDNPKSSRRNNSSPSADKVSSSINEEKVLSGRSSPGSQSSPPGSKESIICGRNKRSPQASSPKKSTKDVDSVPEKPLQSSGKHPDEVNGLKMSPKKQGKIDNVDSIESSISTLESDSGCEESQEIIESSQEHFSGLVMKQCHVSLEHFRVADLADKTEIEDVIVEKGADARSPFRILPKDHIKLDSRSPVRRSLVLESPVDKVSSPPTEPILSEVSCKNANMDMSPVKKINTSSVAVVDNFVSDNVLSKTSDVNVENTEVDEMECDKAVVEKEPVPVMNGDVPPHSRNKCLPDWMHEKKSSPPRKGIRVIRASARSQAFMKQISDVDFSSSPPKSTDVSPLSSPVQSKRTSKSAESNLNTTPIIKRSSRAAQLLGLGQAAAVRGGHTVFSNAVQPGRPEKTGEMNEEGDVAHSSGNSNTSSSVGNCTSVISTTTTNSISATSAVASPSMRRQGRILELDLQKTTPSKCLEDEGLKEDWVPKTPCANATPDSSILKRKRENESDAPSPSVKRKRVSFRDPPLSCMLKFGETTEAPGTVFCSDWSAEVVFINDKTSSVGDLGRQHLDDVMLTSSMDCDSPSKRKTSSPHKQDTLEKPTVEGTNEKVGDGKSKNAVVADSKEGSNGVDTIEEERCSPDLRSQRKSLEVENMSNMNGEHERKSRKSEKSAAREKSCEKLASEGKEFEILCELDKSIETEQGESETQGMLDDLHRMSSTESQVYPSLVNCTHPIECIALKLTSPVWKKALMGEFSDYEIRTVGDLSKLTEDRLDRLSLKPPKRTNVYSVLEDFKKRHCNLKDGLNCGISESISYKDARNSTKDVCYAPEKPQVSLKDVLASASDEDIVITLNELGRDKSIYPAITKLLQPQDVVKAIGSDLGILGSLPVDVITNLYISQASRSTGKAEQNISVEELTLILHKVSPNAIQNTMFPSAPNILSSIFSDKMRDYVLRECSSADIVQHLDETKLAGVLKQVLHKHSPFDIVQCLDKAKMCQVLQSGLETVSPLEFVKYLDTSKVHQLLKPLLEIHSSDEIMQCLDSTKVQDLFEPILKQCLPHELIELCDISKRACLLDNLISKLGVEHVAPKILQELSPLDITKLLDDRKAEETIKALLSKFNLRKGLSICFPDILKLAD